MSNDSIDVRYADRFVPFSDDAIHAMLVKHYMIEIGNTLDLPKLAESIREDIESENEECGYTITNSGEEYIGSVLSLSPSGKYYTGFACGNVSDDLDFILDAAWNEALDRLAENAGGCIVTNEGDPCDLMFYWEIDKNEFRR